MAADLEERFKNAVQLIQSLPPSGPFQPSNEMKLKFYAYFKQAAIGKCTGRRPAFYDLVGRYKWDAWNYLGDLPKDRAMECYIDELKKIIEVMPQTEQVTTFLASMGPIFEMVDDDDDDTKSEPIIIDDTSTIEDSHPASTPDQDEETVQSQERSQSSDSEDEFCDSTDKFENEHVLSRATLPERVATPRMQSELREMPRTVEPTRPVVVGSESMAVSQQILQTLTQMHSELNRVEQRLNKLERRLQGLSVRGRWLLWLMGSFPVIAALLLMLLIRAKRK